jgi:sortase A
MPPGRAMSAEYRPRWLVAAEWTGWVVGILCLTWYAFVSLHASYYQRVERAVLAGQLAFPPPFHGDQDAAAPAQVDGGPIGRLEIARLHLSAIVTDGDDEETLRVSVGHLPDTPLPWTSGNTALAGHRDTFFRPLQDVHVDDVVRLVTSRGAFTYQVRRTLIVRPDEIWVLAPTSWPSLTLVTCYPFIYVGHAPLRFIVQADLVDGLVN